MSSPSTVGGIARDAQPAPPQAALPTGPLSAPECVPLRDAAEVRALGRVVVLAPHADDESLGCGGLIALAAAAGQRPHVVLVTDGTRSHPNSPSYPAPRLRALREAELARACARLGATHAALRHPDCGLPAPGTDAFARGADGLATAIGDADTLLVPWRRDPHCDHERTWQLARAARARRDRPVRWIEYPVWAWTKVGQPEAPRAGEGLAWRLDIAAVLPAKRRAVAAHRSQTTRMIADDPDGFCLAPDMLALFDRPYELFLEPHDVA